RHENTQGVSAHKGCYFVCVNVTSTSKGHNKGHLMDSPSPSLHCHPLSLSHYPFIELFVHLLHTPHTHTHTATHTPTHIPCINMHTHAHTHAHTHTHTHAHTQ